MFRWLLQRSEPMAGPSKILPLNQTIAEEAQVVNPPYFPYSQTQSQFTWKRLVESCECTCLCC